jgi:hypothetical protein
MTRGVALVANIAAVVALTGEQDLANLEADSELTVATLLVSASDAIFDQLQADDVDPTLLSNQVVYERAVAWHFLAILVIRKYLPLPEGLEPPKNEIGHADPYTWSDPFYSRVRPLLTTGDEPSRAGQVVPRVGNLRPNPIINRNRIRGGSYYGDRPTKRT